MNSLAFTLFFVILNILLVVALLVGLWAWSKMKENKWNPEVVFSMLFGLAFISLVIVNVGSTTLTLIEQPRYCWNCETTEEGYLLKEVKPLTLRELFPVNLDAIQVEIDHAWEMREIYFDIVLHNQKYSEAFNQCIFLAVTEKFESIWGNLLLSTRFSQEEVEARIKLCRDALQE